MLRTRLVAGVTSGVVLSSVFATALTVASYFDAVVEDLRVRPREPAPVTLHLPRTMMHARGAEPGAFYLRVLPTTIEKGSIVRDDATATVVRLYEAARRPPRVTQVAAQWAVYFALILAATTYMRRFSDKTGALLRTQVGLLTSALALLVATKLLVVLTTMSAFLVPVSLVPLWTASFVDRRTAAMLAIVISACAASLIAYEPIVSVVYLITSTTAALAFRTRKSSALLIVAGVFSGSIGALAYIATKEIFDGFSLSDELAAGWRSGPLSTLAAGTGSGLSAFVLLPLVTRMFGVVSRSRLLGLSDLEQPLLRKMADEAPGSWAHARAMANLAEAAAASIGADTLLTRVGAYYHDLGKTSQPKYFIENLEPGERSPHEDLEPEVSADAIMAHVVEGTRILREGRIPEAVVEFSYTHHGTSIIEYFWHKCVALGNPKHLTEDAFRYPGVRPRTRETAILMLIDSIEAGARTVDPPSRERFQEMAQRVLFVKLHQGQLDDSGLSIGDLHVLATEIVDVLTNAYHKRIRYPWQDARDRGETPLPIPAAPAPEPEPEDARRRDA